MNLVDVICLELLLIFLSYPFKSPFSTACRDADAGPVPAPRRATREALQTQEGPDGFLRLAAVRPGKEV